jgi:hypothetical protein
MQIFNSPYKTTQSWASQGAIIEYGIGGSTFEPIPLMVSDLSLTYQQSIAPMFPLNTDGNNNATKINIKGAPTGTLSLTSIYCPIPKNIEKFLELASRECVGESDGLVITLRPFGDIKCAAGTTVDNDSKFWLEGVELTSIGLNIRAGEVTVVNMPLNFVFTLLRMGND